MLTEIVFAGFGGQGIMTMGTALASAAMKEGKEVTWLPSYGAEQRGGTANCTVVVADEPIASPIADHPGVVVAMNLPSLDKFEPRAAAGATIMVNSSLVPRQTVRTDVVQVRVPANELAEKLGSARVANMVMLGALAAVTGVASVETLEALYAVPGAKGADLARLNRDALRAGRDQVAPRKD
jgi:2-oxoglutarate ferredoxin oxidoreductase subunit gamma